MKSHSSHVGDTVISIKEMIKLTLQCIAYIIVQFYVYVCICKKQGIHLFKCIHTCIGSSLEASSYSEKSENPVNWSVNKILKGWHIR